MEEGGRPGVLVFEDGRVFEFLAKEEASWLRGGRWWVAPSLRAARLSKKKVRAQLREGQLRGSVWGYVCGWVGEPFWFGDG